MKNAKKFFSLAMVLLMVLSLAPTAVCAENTGDLLTNGGFEMTETRTVGEGETATEYLWPAKVNGKEVWYANPTSGGAYSRTVEGTEVLLTSEEVHSGSYSLKVVPHASNKRRITQWVDGLTPGIWYEAEAWILISGSNITGTNAYGADLLVGDQRGASYGKSSWRALATVDGNSARTVKTTNNKWTKMTARWQQPTEETHAVIALEMGTAAEGSTYYYDDISVKEISGFDGTFETVTTEKLAGNDTVLWPKGVAVFNYSNQLGAYVGEVMATSDKAMVHSGNYALKMVPGTAYSRRATLFVPNLTAGKTYKVKAYMQISSALSGAASLHVGPSYVAGGGDMWGKSSDYKAVTEGWREISTTFTVPESYRYAIINFNSGMVAEGTTAEVYFDDVTVSETNVIFRNAEGTALQKAEAGTILVEGDFINQKNEQATVKMVVAVYTTDTNNVRKLSAVQITEGTAKANGAVTIPATIEVESADQTVQVMFFDSALTNLSLLYPKFVLPAAQ